jgi:hypothetical protein
MRRLLAFAFVIIFSTSPTAVAIRYTVTDLGTLPGHDVSHPYIAAEPEAKWLGGRSFFPRLEFPRQATEKGQPF